MPKDKSGQQLKVGDIVVARFKVTATHLEGPGTAPGKVDLETIDGREGEVKCTMQGCCSLSVTKVADAPATPEESIRRGMSADASGSKW